MRPARQRSEELNERYGTQQDPLLRRSQAHQRVCGFHHWRPRYARSSAGPAPDRYEHYFATLIHEEKAIGVNEVIYRDGHCSEREPNLFLFSDSEVKILATVKEFF